MASVDELKFVYHKDRFYLTVDAVVFTIIDKELKILLVQRKYEPFKGCYALPGGFVKVDENLEVGVARELEEETGVLGIYLKQLPAFGDVGRDPRGRIVTIPYLALIDGEKVKLHATGDAELAKWHDAYSLPQLSFDHDKIITNALERLREDVINTNIAIKIMPERFTLSELQNAYEIILGRQLDKRNFRKKIKEQDILKELPDTRMDGAHRPAQLYSFKAKAGKGL